MGHDASGAPVIVKVQEQKLRLQLKRFISPDTAWQGGCAILSTMV
jgi:hypothetical protein